MSDVLIVDDSLTVRMDLGRRSRRRASSRRCAPTSRERARARSPRGDFALVVLDVILPDGDGIELLGELSAVAAPPATPVVLLSTEAEVSIASAACAPARTSTSASRTTPRTLVARARDSSAGARRAARRASRPVLVVDDSLTVREALRADLEAAGLEVVTAASAEEGLRVAAERRPSAVVVDGACRAWTAPTFVRQLRADAALRTTPCILLTASGAVGELRALEAGADAFVRKERGARGRARAAAGAPARSPRPRRGRPPRCSRRSGSCALGDEAGAPRRPRRGCGRTATTWCAPRPGRGPRAARGRAVDAMSWTPAPTSRPRSRRAAGVKGEPAPGAACRSCSSSATRTSRSGSSRR